MADGKVPVRFEVVGLNDLQRANKLLKGMGGNQGSVAKSTKQFENLNKSKRNLGHTAQNVGYQVQDLIVQIQGGTDAARAFSQQLPQMVVGFGAWGAAIGIVAAALPALIASLARGEEQIEDQSTAIDSLTESLGNLTNTTQAIDMSGWISEFTAADEAQQKALSSLLAWNQAVAERNQRRAVEPLAEQFGSITQLSGPVTGALDVAMLERVTQNRQIGELQESLGLTPIQLAKTLPLYEDIIESRGQDADAIAELLRNLRQFDIESEKGNENLTEQIKLMTQLEKAARDLAATQQTLTRASSGTLPSAGGDVSASVGPPQSLAGGFGDLSAQEAELLQQFALDRNMDIDSVEDTTFYVLAEGANLFGERFEQAVAGVAAGTQDIEDAFGSMVQSVVADLAKLAAQWLANAAVSALFGGPADVSTKAKGDVIAGGQVQTYAKGGVVSGPTLFPMANGAGLMGEAGPEAIMPLGRNSRGELGVKGGAMNVTVNNLAPGVQVQTSQTDQGLVIDLVMAEVAAGIRRGGSIVSSAMEDTYGVGRGRSVY